MNIFKKNWYKHFKKGENPTKLADDLDKMRGIVTVRPYDVNTGQILGETVHKNTLVNQSKTNLIRLISQGQSPWITGNIDPTQLRISKMRFGNGNDYIANKFYYYKLDEPSGRICHPIVGNTFAGGKAGATACGSAQVKTTTLAKNTSNYKDGPNGTKIFTIKSDILPPSQGTLKVELIYNNGLTETVVETIYFYNPALPDEILDKPYSRTADGIFPIQMQCSPSNAPVSTPQVRNLSGIATIDQENPQTNTRIFYDYTLNNNGWKLLLEEINVPGYTLPTWTHIKFTYENGKYNIINSIVPKDGYNEGVGLTMANRYIYNVSGLDYYSILPNMEYRDCDSDYIDDFSVTFAVNMSGQYGNGQTDAAQNQYINYPEAFLFNERDEIFSSIKLSTGFNKNSSLAYYISWTILAPIE
jgi:hypothetical protein